MRGFLRRLFGPLGLDGRDWTVLLLSLLLAFSIWILHNLSLKYTETITVPVRAKCRIEGHAELSSNTSEVVGRCRAIGFNLIRAKVFSHRGERIVEFDREALLQKDADTYYIVRQRLEDNAHMIFGEGTSEHQVFSDTIWFNFAKQSCKKVPVRLVGDIELERQYMLTGEVRLSPDSVMLYGEDRLLEKMQELRTERLHRSSVHSDVQGNLKLEKVKGVEMSDESVRYSASVVRYVEMKQSFPVEVWNAPSDRSILLIPSVVEATFRCVFPFDEDPLEKVSFHVDCNDLLSSRSFRCPVYGDKMGSDVISYSVEPESVEIIISEK